MENDDRKRPRKGVVVTLLDMGDGTSRVVMDDVSSEFQSRDTSWKFDYFYTYKSLDSKAIDAMALADVEYQSIGEALMARLLALNSRMS
jgi:hypothetical protein